MKHRLARKVLLLAALLVLLSAIPVGAADDINCILGFITRDMEGRTFCQYTLPPGNCVICYEWIEVKVQV